MKDYFLSSTVDFFMCFIQDDTMEMREIKGLPLSCFTDSLMGISYVKILTERSLEAVKLPKGVDLFKQGYLLQSMHLLEIELIKTRKNWILREITNFAPLFQLHEYKDFLKHKEIISMLLTYIKEDQEVNVLHYLVQTFYQKNMAEVELEKFESGLLNLLGFAKKNDARSVAQIRQEGDINN